MMSEQEMSGAQDFMDDLNYAAKLEAEKQQFIKDEIEAEYRQEAEDQHFQDWFSDNKEELRIDFIGDREDEFDQYCRDAFKQRE